MKTHHRKAISRALLEAALRRIRDGVSILDINVSPTARDRIERVAYIFRCRDRNPNFDAFAELKRLAAGRYPSATDEWHAAKKDMLLFEAVLTAITQ